ncbi:GGDEF domain-containing protein [Vibrio sonorensis]|uniref:GGDEF domain-containing protein n=1 Tax=Vibrio sonorensis TaxID=1004316 RepID=UPI001FE1D226|nr:GGDEF domain-containing protein [Vibrio sonorensis]
MATKRNFYRLSPNMVHSSKSHLSPLLGRAKKLLMIMSAALIVANLYLLSATRDLASSYSQLQNQATWFIFQLTKEFTELNTLTPYSHASLEEQQQVLLQYELTWSRFDLVLNNQESDSLMELEGARTFFVALFKRYQEFEPDANRLGDPNYTRSLGAKYNAIYEDMIRYINTNFRVQSPLNQSQEGQAKFLTQIQFFLMFLLFFSVGLVSYILHKEALHHKALSLTDPLTNIPNRLALIHSLKGRVGKNAKFSFLLLDLNGFKAINDNFGHQSGDLALRTLSTRMVKIKNQYHCELFRIGGDEFAMISDEVEPIALKQLVKEINRCFEKPIILNDKQPVTLSTSIGVAQFPDDSKNFNQLITIADKNMYKMKFSQKKKAV